MTESVVVVGAGLAAAHVVQTLREEGFTGDIAVVGDEGLLPYERPPLSKQLLLDQAEPDSVFVKDADYYAANDVELHLEDAAVTLDRDARSVRLATGASLGYDALVLATGAHPRTLELPGAELDGVVTLRRLGDSLRLRAELQPGRRVVIVGGGWIGLEVAAAARSHDCEVTVLEAGDRPLGAVLGPRLGDHFAALHRSHGVDVRTRSGVEGFVGRDGRVSGVLVDGAELAADLVLVGVGAVPNTELAESSGLAADNGILVDSRLRTADPAVLAAGDVANAAHTILGRLRVEHWDNAIRQGALAARTILGREAAYDWQPYFFTDQYDLGMEYVGHADASDDVVLRGDPDGGEFIAFWLADGSVRAAMNVNIWDVSDTLRALIGREIAASSLSDPGISLADLAG